MAAALLPSILESEAGRLYAAAIQALGITFAPWQPHQAGRLAPERLGFDDLAELPVVRAVVPAICINSHHSTVHSTSKTSLQTLAGVCAERSASSRNTSV